MKILFAFIIVFIGSHSLLADERKLRIVELKSSLAEPTLNIIKPHLPTGAGASAHENKLLLNLSDAEWEQLSPILDALDKAPTNVMVNVRIFKGSEAAERRQWWRVQASTTQGISAQGSVQYHSDQQAQSSQQQVRTLSGQAAFIRVSEEIPYLTFRSSPHHGGIITTQYHATGNGFYVLPRVQGDEVQVFINPEQATRSNNQIKTAALQTETRGSLGAWMLLARSGETSYSSGHYSSNATENWLVEIKVDKLP